MRVGSYCLFRLPGSEPDLQKEREYLLKLLRDRCLIRSEQEPLFSPKGKKIGWILDVRMALLDPTAMVPIAALFWDSMSKYLPFQLVCTTELPASIRISSGP
jgi:hypothetical protein